MSLINDALKKAQRQRGEDPGYTPPMPGGSGSGGGVRKRGAPMPAQTIVLIVVGCIVLVAATIITTVLLVRTKPSDMVAAPKIEAPTPKTTPTVPTHVAPPVETPAEKPVPIVAAIPKPLPVEPKPEPTPEPVVATPTPVATSRPVATPVAEQVPPKPISRPAAAASSTVTAIPTRLALPDERVYAFLDALRVTGIRSSGTDSRVLMNDKVYRVNDIVDRNFELRLTKVATDALTFTDANGVVYVKNF